MEETLQTWVTSGHAYRSYNFVGFINEESPPAELYWINYKGKLAQERTLAPGKPPDTFTFVTHPLVVVDDAGKCLGFYRPSVDPSIALIKPESGSTVAGSAAAMKVPQHLNALKQNWSKFRFFGMNVSHTLCSRSMHRGVSAIIHVDPTSKPQRDSRATKAHKSTNIESLLKLMDVIDDSVGLGLRPIGGRAAAVKLLCNFAIRHWVTGTALGKVGLS